MWVVRRACNPYVRAKSIREQKLQDLRPDKKNPVGPEECLRVYEIGF
jgi:hypothetical protein